MKKCPFESFKTKIWLWNKRPVWEDIEVKEKTEDILAFLSERDLNTITSEKQTISLEDFQEFIASIKNLEGRKKIDCIKDYILENLQELRNLKKELNNLHIKMFWEFFKEKLQNLWEHDFFWIKDGELINIPLSHYVWLWEKMNNRIIDTFFINLPLFKDKISFYKYKKSLNINNKVINDYQKVFEELYKDFIEEHKNQDIIKFYLALEETIVTLINFSSEFNIIFPNVNKIFLIKYLSHQLRKNIEIELWEITKFLSRQNKANINLALNGWAFWAELQNLYIFELWKYNEDSWIVKIHSNDITKEIREKINKNVKNHYMAWAWDTGCPFAKTKSWTQNKNALIEEFEFFDTYMLKILGQYFN